jgi:putative heme-binding domain-containing protein
MLTAVGVGMMTIAVLTAQHNFTPAEVENGGRLYQSTCAGCHGIAGDQVPGTALRSGKFRRGTTDEEIARIIRTGIPGTGMAAQVVSETEAAMIVAWLRGNATIAVAGLKGDPGRGKALFETRGNCTSCHGPGGVGGRRAPTLTNIGVLRQPPQLERALVEPSAEIHTDFRTITATTKAGATMTGRLLNQSSFSIQLLDDKGNLRSLDKADVKDSVIATSSTMPSYRQRLTPQEIADLVAFLGTMRGGQ